jgi:hypothetical protein
MPASQAKGAVMNGPDREALLGRIQALLNKTVERGATEAEAQAALAVAQRLMDAHNIELAQVVDHDPDAVAFGHEVGWEGKSADSLYDAAIPIIAEVFAVRCVRVRSGVKPPPEWARLGMRPRTTKVEILLIGDPTNRDAARWALDFLAGTFRRLWDAYRIGTGNGDRWSRRAYVEGLVHGFLARARAERADAERERPGSTNALVPLRGRLDRAVEAITSGWEEDGRRPEIEDSAWADPGAYQAGRRDGQDINLARPIGRSRARGLRRLPFPDPPK